MWLFILRRPGNCFHLGFLSRLTANKHQSQITEKSNISFEMRFINIYLSSLINDQKIPPHRCMWFYLIVHIPQIYFQNFEPVAVPASDHGKFFTGDSYIILNTKEDNKKRLSWDVHFWLGLETSQDEAGAAAILTIQLDDLLGGAPVQHREVQEHESSKFLGYFRNSKW